LIAQEDRDDRGWRFVGTKAVVVRRRSDRRPQQTTELVHRPYRRRAEHEELRVVVRVVAGQEEVAGVGTAKREVDVFARTVDADERLLVEEAFHSVLLRDALHDRHEQLLVVGRDVRSFEHGRDFELAGRDLVVARLRGDAELEKLALRVEHEREHALGNRAEVVVVEFLSLRCLRAEERAPGVEQVGPGEEEAAVDQEVLLLGTGEGHHRFGLVVAEESEHSIGLRRHCLLRSQQRCLVVERFAGHRDEDRRDAQGVAIRIFENVRGACHVHAV
jgi:hypothetical protein